MCKSKPYAAVAVKQVQELGLAQVMQGLDGPQVWVGIDVSKSFLMVVPCAGPGRFGRPWRVNQPSQLAILIELLSELSATRKVSVALEPTGRLTRLDAAVAPVAVVAAGGRAARGRQVVAPRISSSAASWRRSPPQTCSHSSYTPGSAET